MFWLLAFPATLIGLIIYADSTPQRRTSIALTVHLGVTFVSQALTLGQISEAANQATIGTAVLVLVSARGLNPVRPAWGTAARLLTVVLVWTAVAGATAVDYGTHVAATAGFLVLVAAAVEMREAWTDPAVFVRHMRAVTFVVMAAVAVMLVSAPAAFRDHNGQRWIWDANPNQIATVAVAVAVLAVVVDRKKWVQIAMLTTGGALIFVTGSRAALLASAVVVAVAVARRLQTRLPTLTAAAITTYALYESIADSRRGDIADKAITEILNRPATGLFGTTGLATTKVGDGDLAEAAHSLYLTAGYVGGVAAGIGWVVVMWWAWKRAAVWAPAVAGFAVLALFTVAPGNATYPAAMIAAISVAAPVLRQPEPATLRGTSLVSVPGFVDDV